MNMLRHQDASVNPGLMTRADLLQSCCEGFPGFLHCEKGKTVEATEGYEVKGFSFLESLQAAGHGVLVTPPGPCPKTRSSR